MGHQINRQAVGTTLTRILDGRPHWRKVEVCALNNIELAYIGFDRSLNSTNGHPLPSNQAPLPIFLSPGTQLWAVGGDAAAEISVFETTDGPELAMRRDDAPDRPAMSIVRMR